jgi:hypothetical protein
VYGGESRAVNTQGDLMMNFETDYVRTANSAFGPASLRDGALLPWQGRVALQAYDGLQQEALEEQEDGWVTPFNPVLVRGAARILPLAWRGDVASGHGTAVVSGEIDELVSQMRDAGLYWGGNWSDLDWLQEAKKNSVASYVSALLDAGATRGNFWGLRGDIALGLIWAGEEAEGTMSLALHVVPTSWAVRRYAEKPVAGIDLRWSWAEVIELYRSHGGGATV